MVRPKKHLGQHFLTDLNTADKTVCCFDFSQVDSVLEVGAGTGVLTERILKTHPLTVVEIDTESVMFLETHFLEECKNNRLRIINQDFLKLDFKSFFNPSKKIALIGNFPYNISSQIVFKVLENKQQVHFFGGMFQKEVAERLCSNKGKSYGILSVLVSAFYQTKYEFTVSEHVFHPPPKVKSAVITMVARPSYDPVCDTTLFFKVIKIAFNQRRKMLSNSLKIFNLPPQTKQQNIFQKRPEQLSVKEFVELTKIISNDRES